MTSDVKDAALFLSGGGEMGARMRAHSWADTSFGDVETWPQSLRSAVSICLGTSFPIAIYWGRDLALLYNDAWAPIPGSKHPRVLGQAGRDVWPEIWDAIGPLFDKVQETGEGVWQQDQLLLMHRHGYTEECYFNFTFSPIRGEMGVEGIFNAVIETTFRVISERRERFLRELAERLGVTRTEAELFKVVAETLSTASADIPFALIYRLTAGQHVELMASTLTDTRELEACIERSGASPLWPFADVIDSGRAESVNALTEKCGFSFPGGIWPESCESALVVPVTSAPGVILGFLVAGISPRRALDQDYMAFFDRISSQLASTLATARAYEEQRQRAEALAEIDRVKTAFFANVSHEFRTPLTLMLTPLDDVLGRSDIPADARPLVELAHRNAQRLLKLVNSLLDFSRIEAGRIQASYQPVDLGAFTSDLASNFRSAMEKAGLKLTVETHPLSLPAYVDRDMWEKVILNLLSNAFKFTFDGEIAVTVAPSSDGNAACVSVRDTGSGIAEDQIGNLFQRFRRIEGARSRSFEGSGIGLALVQELVHLHGGKIDVQSRENVGTTFTITLPLGSEHLPTANIVHDAAQPQVVNRAQAFVNEAMGWLRGGDAPAELPRSDLVDEKVEYPADADQSTILVADDNADMRRYVTDILRTAGYKVQSVEDGRSALEAIRGRPPELVLSDVMMPNLDGQGLLSAVRSDPALQHIPFLLLSARAGAEARIEGLRSGADDYLTKPFTAAELIARIGTQIKLSKIRKESARRLQEEADTLTALNKVGNTIAAEIDLERAVQAVTDAATQLSGAQFGAFFYNVLNAEGESYMLYTLSGAPREAFSKFPQPRATAVFAPTFKGEGIFRSDDITKDPRFGQNAPYHGHPKGHLPVVSYLAVPVMTESGEVAGGLFFGHKEPGIFDARAERIVAAIATQAGIALDKARMFRALRESEQNLEKTVAQRTEALKAANQELVRQMAEREQVEERLRHAQKLEAVGQLTGGVAHDFNNMLAIVVGSLNLLGRRLKSAEPQIQKYIDSALEGTQRAAQLTQRLLAFSRQQALAPQTIDPNKLVVGMSELLRSTLGRDIILEAVTAGGAWSVFADQGQLENAIVNIAVNARDAMPDGGRLTIETQNAYLDDRYSGAHLGVPAGQYLLISVTDTGTGIPPDIIEKVFDPFFTTKSVGKGTGLGLSQVYGFVKQSGGHVKIYSEAQKGTSVKIYLPRHVPAGLEAPAAAERPSALQEGHQELILVVDDENAVRSLTVDALKELGYAVLEASDGFTALRILEQNPDIALLLTDIVMPEMSGRALSDRARAIRGSLKTLYMTGFTRNAVVHNGVIDSGVHMIGKPFSIEELADKVRAVLDS